MSEDLALIEALSDYHGFSSDELTAAARILELQESEFVVRFTELVSFARSFGVAPLELAKLVKNHGTGVRPWRDPLRPLRSDE